MENQLQQIPRQLVADGGYSTRDNIEKMAERGIDFLGSMGREEMPSGTTAPQRLPPSAFIYQAETNRYVCPEGKLLRPQGRYHKKKKRGLMAYWYEAKFSDCAACLRKPECCPENQRRGRGVIRRVENPAIQAPGKDGWRGSAAISPSRKSRGILPCRIRAAGSAAVHVRRLRKVQSELLWACLTYNLQHWIRLSKLLPALPRVE